MTLKYNTKLIMQDLIVTFNDLRKIDKVAATQETVNEVKVTMESNIKKTLDN